MAYTTINDSTAYFQTKLFTGNSSTNAITFDGNTNMQPDWSWFKRRDGANGHSAFDSVRGVTKLISPNQTAAEQTVSDAVTSFNTNGFTLGSDSNNFINDDGLSYVAWNWKANGSGSANTDGSINSTVSANQTAGFSIVSYTGNATSGATIGHGLNSVPQMIITKNRDQSSASQDWCVYHVGVGANKGIFLNLTNSPDTNAKYFNDTTPTSSVFTVGNNLGTNGSGDDMIAYCFANKTGYSKFGSYTGNGNADGTFVYTGFKPAFVIIKRSDATQGWLMWDSKRLGYNPDNNHLQPHGSDAEGTADTLDLLSNGFKIRESGAGTNGSGASYIFMAFGQSLVGSNNVPCTAR